mgnify:FL=1
MISNESTQQTTKKIECDSPLYRQKSVDLVSPSFTSYTTKSHAKLKEMQPEELTDRWDTMNDLRITNYADVV